MPSLNIYNSTQIQDIACNYARALYRSIPNKYRTEDILYICANPPQNTTPHNTTEDEPLAWELDQIVEILPDFIFAWGDDWEPENNLIKDVLGGPLDKPSELICPVSPEPGWPEDAAYLRQMIAYYKHLVTARTYYINICAASKLYTSYRMYLDSINPIPGSNWDWSSSIDLTMDDGSVLYNVFSPGDLLSSWKELFTVSGPTFAQWLWGRYTGIYGAETSQCADGIDIFDVIVPFVGIEDIFDIKNTDSWWTSYSVSAAISPNLGSSMNSIAIADKKFITTNNFTSINIPAYRISWEDVWYPFINDPNLQNNIVNFSEAIFTNIKYGPTVIQGSSTVCEPVGACCVNEYCLDDRSECQCVTLLGGEFIEDVECETGPCLTPTPSITPSITSSITATPTYTPTNSKTPTIPETQEPTLTPSLTASATPTNTLSATATSTLSTTPTSTPSVTPTNTPSVTPTNTLSATPTKTPGPSLSPSNSATPTTTLSQTNTATPTSSNN
jgi:hypothetical protein